jgi:uncharacterized metal-binding protein YceD (DUF177 family)
MNDNPPFSSSYDLNKVPEKGRELVLKPTAAERSQIAAWLGIEALESLQAVVKLSRTGSGHYLYRGHFDADVVQACVVTLEPVPAHLAEDFERDFEIAPVVRHSGRRGHKPAAVPAAPIIDLDEDVPEMLEGPVIDLAAPLLEELSLSLDPYPRKAGIEFTQPEEEPVEAPDNPFAVLGKLKRS